MSLSEEIERLAVKRIPGYRGYFVDCEGQVYSCRKPGLGQPNRNKLMQLSRRVDKDTGYYVVTVTESDGKHRQVFVHRLVLFAFHGAAPSPKHQCAHFDGNKLNCKSSNLRWATPKENNEDKVRHGTSRGHKCTRLTKDQIKSMVLNHLTHQGVDNAI